MNVRPLHSQHPRFSCRFIRIVSIPPSSQLLPLSPSLSLSLSAQLRSAPLLQFSLFNGCTMKIIPNSPTSPYVPKTSIPLKPTRRKASKSPHFSGRKHGPPTPLLRWKFLAMERDCGGEAPSAGAREFPEGKAAAVSARKLAAALWRLQLNGGAGEGEEAQRKAAKKRADGVGFKPGVVHTGDRLSCHHGSRGCGSEAKDQRRSAFSVNGRINRNLCEPHPAFQFVNYAMEGVTKWDPVCSIAANEEDTETKSLDEKPNTDSLISAFQAELEQAQARIDELESERRSSKKKLEHFLQKLSEERAAWRSREHEKVRAIIDDVKADLNRERKNRRRLEISNSRLVNELAEAKLSSKRYMQDYEKARKARELVEEVCDELAKEIGEDKAEAETLKRECMKARDEMEEDRKMLQMAEVWREERVQMKLIDAKVTLEHKYLEMNKLIAKLENFLRSRGASLDLNDMREADMLKRAAASVNIQDIKELTYEPPNPDDIFSVVEELAMAEANEREIKPCAVYSPDNNHHNRDKLHRISNVYFNQDDDDGSGWETVSHVEDQGSSCSPGGSIRSINKICQYSNFSGVSAAYGENIGDETPVTEISEVCSVPSKPPRKVQSISRLWRSYPNHGDNYKVISVDGIKGRLSNGRISNGEIMSSDQSLSDKAGWSSPDSMNPRMSRGCIEWPRSVQKHSLKQKLQEARIETQKIQLHQVLKQKS